MKSLFAKTDNSVFNIFKNHFLLCYHVFIVLVAAFFSYFFNLVKITQLQFDWD